MRFLKFVGLLVAACVIGFDTAAAVRYTKQQYEVTKRQQAIREAKSGPKLPCGSCAERRAKAEAKPGG